MGKINKEEQEVFEKSLKWLSGKQRFNLFWWSIFSERKVLHYIEKLQQGMNPSFAFMEAKKINK